MHTFDCRLSTLPSSISSRVSVSSLISSCKSKHDSNAVVVYRHFGHINWLAIVPPNNCWIYVVSLKFIPTKKHYINSWKFVNYKLSPELITEIAAMETNKLYSLIKPSWAHVQSLTQTRSRKGKETALSGSISVDSALKIIWYTSWESSCLPKTISELFNLFILKKRKDQAYL